MKFAITITKRIFETDLCMQSLNFIILLFYFIPIL
jgi:hypothetical protein